MKFGPPQINGVWRKKPFAQASATRGNFMRIKVLLTVVCLLTMVSVARADDRNWQTGTLTATEKQQVPTGSTVTTSTDASGKSNGDSSKYSGSSTKTKTDNYDTYQVFTIESGNTIYVARERLLFPWSKPAKLSLGKEVKFAVEGDSMYILDGAEKQHKATIVKSSLKQ
jgi:hypothetical protein